MNNPVNKKSHEKEVILVFGAHSDDFVIGVGGTISKYAQEGKRVISVVFSYGENSHPWLKEEVVQKFRADEAVEASKFLDSKIIFFDLQELKFYKEYKEKHIQHKLMSIINRAKPTKIFTHSSEDPHPDHRDVHKITLELLKKIHYKPEVYVYSVWNPVSFKTKYPALYVNITKHFGVKLKALKSFRSQFIHIIYPFFLLLFNAIKNGFKIGTLFGEKFYRIK